MQRAGPASTPPIVLVVFDEFPLHSLLDADGRIDHVRFPHFAALARERVVVSRDHHGVVADRVGRARDRQRRLSGRTQRRPTLRYYPQNLFTLLADRYEMFVFGRFLQLCPEGQVPSGS